MNGFIDPFAPGREAWRDFIRILESSSQRKYQTIYNALALMRLKQMQEEFAQQQAYKNYMASLPADISEIDFIRKDLEYWKTIDPQIYEGKLYKHMDQALKLANIDPQAAATRIEAITGMKINIVKDRKTGALTIVGPSGIKFSGLPENLKSFFEEARFLSPDTPFEEAAQIAIKHNIDLTYPEVETVTQKFYGPKGEILAKKIPVGSPYTPPEGYSLLSPEEKSAEEYRARAEARSIKGLRLREEAAKRSAEAEKRRIAAEERSKLEQLRKIENDIVKYPQKERAIPNIQAFNELAIKLELPVIYVWQKVRFGADRPLRVELPKDPAGRQVTAKDVYETMEREKVSLEKVLRDIGAI